VKNYCLMKETTNWHPYAGSNGIYVFEDKPTNKRVNKALGYIAPNNDDVKWFNTPLGIDFKGRTFIQVCK